MTDGIRSKRTIRALATFGSIKPCASTSLPCYTVVISGCSSLVLEEDITS